MVKNIAKAAHDGDWEEVRRRVERGDNLNALYGLSTKETALHIAAGKGNKAICELLLKRGANIGAVDVYGGQPLHVAAYSRAAGVCELLVAHGADANSVNDFGMTPLMLVVKHASPAVCAALITSDNVNFKAHEALHSAAAWGHIQNVQLLIECGADINAVNKCGQTPLHTAAGGYQDCPELCEILLKHGAKMDAKDKDGNQPLHLACKQGHSGAEKLLVAYGADVTVTNVDGHTPVHLVRQHLVGTNEEGGAHLQLHVAAKMGHVETVQQLLDSGADVNTVIKHGRTLLHTIADGWLDCPELCDMLLKHGGRIDLVDEDGNQPLHLACRQAHTEIGKWLLCHGVDANGMNKHYQTPLHIAAGGRENCPDLCRDLLEYGAAINVMDENGDQPLHLACKQGHLNTGKELMSCGADIRSVNQQGQTPLHAAAGGWKDSHELCKDLLELGANVNVIDENSDQPLHLACKQGHINTGKELISGGANTNAVNQHGQTPLHIAADCWEDCHELCKDLLEHGADINVRDENDDQPLHLACKRGHINTGKDLISRKADTNAVNNLGQTPLHTVAGGWKDCLDLCKDLLEHGADINIMDEVNDQPLHLACKRGHTNTGKELISRGADTNVVNKFGQTPLQIITGVWWKEHLDLCKELLEHGANTKVVDESGNQPLHLVCEKGHINTGKELISHGADTNAVNRRGQTPLLLVAYGWRDFFDLCKDLVEHGADVNVMDENGDQPLHLACKRGHINTGKELISHGADTNAVNRHGQTPLHTTAGGWKDCPDLCKDLLKHGAAINVMDKNGDQPLHFACIQGHINIGKELMIHGADTNAVNRLRQTPLQTVAGGKKEYPDLCKNLLEYGADTNVIDENGGQPLHLACNLRHVNISKELMSHGADVNAVNKHGQTPLHISAGVQKDNPDLCEALLEHGADINVMDKHDDQPLHLACKLGHVNIAKELLSHEANTNAVNKCGQTPLHIVVGDYPDLHKYILEHSADVNVMDENGDQPLHLACRQGHFDTGKELISCGANTNAVNKCGQTPLHKVAGGMKDCPDLCKDLLDHGADVNGMDENGDQPLHLACKQSHLNTGKELISCGADTKASNKYGQTPLHITAGAGRECLELCKDLLEHGADVDVMDKNGNQPLHFAVEQTNINIGKELLSCGANVNCLNNKGKTPLHCDDMSIIWGDRTAVHVVSVIVKAGFDVNIADGDGNSCLHLACEAGLTSTVELLLVYNADVLTINSDGQTPLHKAASSYFVWNSPEVCELLMEKGAIVNAVDGNGDTPLHVALQHQENMETARVLIENGADCAVLNSCRETVLHSKGAVYSQELCEGLISQGASPDTPDRDGNLPFHVALKNGCFKTFCFLFEQWGGSTLDDLQKLNIAIGAADIGHLLCTAIHIGDHDCCNKLLGYGANVNVVDKVQCKFSLKGWDLPMEGFSPLHLAVVKNYLKLCRLLLDHGACVNAQIHTKDERSSVHLAQPLHLAACLGYIDICRLLIKCGAHLNTEMKDGQSPLHIALVQGKVAVVRLLLSHGAILDDVKIKGGPAAAEGAPRRLVSLLHHHEAFPDEIVSQGETAVQIYLSSCRGGTAVTLFLRVDVVGRDGAGKTSLTKSLTLQEFDPEEPSTRGVVIDPKCQIVVREACDWTTPLTRKYYQEMYDRNITTIMADKLDTPKVKDQYFTSKNKERQQREKQKRQTHKLKNASAEIQVDTVRTTATGVIATRLTYPDQTERHTSIDDPKSSFKDDHNSGEKSNLSDVTDTTNSLSLQTPLLHSDSSSPQIGVISPTVSPAIVLPPSGRNPVSVLAPHMGEVSNPISIPVSQQLVTTLSVQSDHCLQKGTISSDPLSSSVPTEHECYQPQSNFDQTCEFPRTSTLAASIVDLQGHSSNPLEAPVSTNTTHIAKKKQCATAKTIPKQRSETAGRTPTIPKHITKSVSGLLRNRKSRQSAKDEMIVTVLDYAGQNVFYATHYLVLSKAGFYYVVFDASQPLEGKTPSLFRVKEGEIIRISQFDNETNFDRMEEWISAIHVIEPEHKHNTRLFEELGIASPAIFLVGTHADELGKQPGLLESQEAFLKKNLNNSELLDHIVWASQDRICFYVDNTITNPDSGTVDPGVHLLREKTEDVARKVAQHHQLPITWMKFEQEVRDLKEKDKCKKTASVEELLQLAKRTVDIKNREELEVLLHYLSNRTVILYHPNALQSCETEVVLDVEWLILKLEKVITIRADVPPMLKKDVNRSVEKGIMTASLVQHLLADSGSAQNLIISLMNYFDLLCQYSGLERDTLSQANSSQDFLVLGDQQESSLSTPANSDIVDSWAYFIPCLLQKPASLQSLGIKCKTMPLHLSSHPLRIPLPLFYRLLTTLCKRFRCLPVLYRNVGYFHISPGHRLEFALNRYSFKMTVLSETNTTPNAEVCIAVRKYIVNLIDKVKQRGMPGLKLFLGYDHDRSSSALCSDAVDFISLDGYPKDRQVLFSDVTVRQVQPPKELALWYPSLLTTSTTRTHQSSSGIYTVSMIPSRQLTYSSPIERLLVEPTEACLVEMAKLLDEEDDDMGDDWRRLWSELINRPLNETMVREKREGPTLFLLKMWCRMQSPSEATIKRLIEALNVIFRNDIARLLIACCERSKMSSTAADGHVNRDDSSVDHSSRTGDVTPSEVFCAVVMCAPSRWHAIALELGFNCSTVEGLVHNIPNSGDKLQCIIFKKVEEVGEQETAALLLQACRDISDPVIADVQKDIKQVLQRVN